MIKRNYVEINFRPDLKKKSIKTKLLITQSYEDPNWLILVDLKNDWLNLVQSKLSLYKSVVHKKNNLNWIKCFERILSSISFS